MLAISIHPVVAAKYIFGDASPLTRSVGISDVSRVGTGRFRLTLDRGSDVADTLALSGIPMVQVTGPYKAAADFVSERVVEVQVHSLTTGGLADPANGTRIQLIVWV